MWMAIMYVDGSIKKYNHQRGVLVKVETFDTCYINSLMHEKVSLMHEKVSHLQK